MRLTFAILLACIATVPVAARKPPPPRWQVSRTSDPITGRTTCIVVAYDQSGRTSYSRTGILYPFVENDPDRGLLVGVSSGGKYRLPTGDILWRVDDQPFRTLRAQDNPLPPAPEPPAGTENVATKAMQDAMALAVRLTVAATATSTVASGERAKEMLAEMLAGHGLIFRSASASQQFGLPNAATRRVGQMTNQGLEPYPLDPSFREGLTSCGLAA
jgi:hypothetical protein